MTAQIRDVLILDGEAEPTNTFPRLPPSGDIVEDTWGWDKDDSETWSPERLDQFFNQTPTCCHRGYVAVWEIRGDRFYLNKVRGTRFKKLREEPVFAEWYSGVLELPRGRLVDRGGYGSHGYYEKVLAITVERGRVVKRELLDAPPPPPQRPAEEAKKPPGLLSAVLVALASACAKSVKRLIDR